MKASIHFEYIFSALSVLVYYWEGELNSGDISVTSIMCIVIYHADVSNMVGA